MSAPARGRPARSFPPLGRQLDDPVDEAEWARRHRKRCEGVRAVKRSAHYIASAAGNGANRPATPDPWDRTLSKRAWEHGMQAWRVDLAMAAERAAGVRAVKRSAHYIASAAGHGADRPATPDPWDRTLSKRAWERGMQAWRVDLAMAAERAAADRALEELAERVAEFALE